MYSQFSPSNCRIQIDDVGVEAKNIVDLFTERKLSENPRGRTRRRLLSKRTNIIKEIDAVTKSNLEAFNLKLKNNIQITSESQLFPLFCFVIVVHGNRLKLFITTEYLSEYQQSIVEGIYGRSIRYLIQTDNKGFYPANDQFWVPHVRINFHMKKPTRQSIYKPHECFNFQVSISVSRNSEHLNLHCGSDYNFLISSVSSVNVGQITWEPSKTKSLLGIFKQKGS